MKRTDFNCNWFFSEFDTPDTGRYLNLPHDAMLEEKRDKNAPGGKGTGYYYGGKYSYRKFWVPDEALQGKKVILEFEGIYQLSEVYLNGELIAEGHYGYLPVFADLTDKIVYGKENIIEVIADNSRQPNSRWYTGSGIYRPVWMHTGEKAGFAPDGVRVSTVSYEPAEVKVRADFHADNTEGTEICLEILQDGKTDQTVTCTIEEKTVSFEKTIRIENAKLWSAELPNLYTCRASLIKNDRVIDCLETDFGVCKLDRSTDGFFVNGERVKLRGCCVHHDNGLLGACEYEDAAFRRISIIKEAGFNAIRSAHNPCSKAILKACDTLGMYIMDEFSDMWYTHKNRFDYASYFEEEYINDLTAMVKKDIGHPSVIMYSLGNEVTETAEPSGIRYLNEMSELVHRLDPSRPTTCGINMALNVMNFAGMGVYKPFEGDPVRPPEPKNPAALKILGQMMEARKRAASSADTTKARTNALGLAKEAGENRDGKLVGSEMFNKMMVTMKEQQQAVVTQDIAKILSEDSYNAVDIAGYNYAEARYVLDAQEYPDRISVGSESLPQKIYKNWKIIEKCPNVIGDFMWTGWDYIGEAGVGSFVYDSYGVKDGAYPALLAGCGVIDILGMQRPECWLNKAVYGIVHKPYIGVEPVTHANEEHLISAWRFSDAIHSWDWKEYEGVETNLVVYSSAPYIALYKNGSIIGKESTVDCCAHFRTTYEKGQLLALALDDNGCEIGRDVLESGNDTEQLQLTLSKNSLVADSQALLYVNIAITDEAGVVHSANDTQLRICVEGCGCIAGFGNAEPFGTGDFFNNICNTYYGRAQAIIRATGEQGTIKLTVASDKHAAVERIIPVC